MNERKTKCQRSELTHTHTHFEWKNFVHHTMNIQGNKATKKTITLPIILF